MRKCLANLKAVLVIFLYKLYFLYTILSIAPDNGTSIASSNDMWSFRCCVNTFKIRIWNVKRGSYVFIVNFAGSVATCPCASTILSFIKIY